MNPDERRLSDLLHRVAPEPPRRVTVEDVAFRLANTAGQGRARSPRRRRRSSARARACRSISSNVRRDPFLFARAHGIRPNALHTISDVMPISIIIVLGMLTAQTR